MSRCLRTSASAMLANGHRGTMQQLCRGNAAGLALASVSS